MSIALTYAAMVHLNRGEPERASVNVTAAETLAEEQRVSFIMEPLFLRGAARVAQGATREAISAIRQGLVPGRPVAAVWRSYALAFLARALAQQGDYPEALTVILEAIDAIGTGERMWHAEVHRVHGVVLLGENKREESEAAFREALQVAREQQAKSLELRAAMSLARLWGEAGRRGEGRELLAPVYGWFTEGFDTADLKEAKALLAELA
jgi:predicted ATPase